jgi:hypothetical protein
MSARWTETTASAPRLARMSGEPQIDKEADIAAIFARLQHEVRRGRSTSNGQSTQPVRRAPLASRAEAERVWAVSAERPIEHPPDRRLRRFLFAPVKRALRKLMRWYVEPVAAQQRSFNLTILSLIDELAERAEADATRLERRVQALEERLGPERPGPNK